jgi:hypothetical protein
MLDKQINLFKVDTNAFLSEDEKQVKIYLNSLNKYKKSLEDFVRKNKSKVKDDKDIELKYDINNCKAKIEELKVEIKLEKKLVKSMLLKLCADKVEYNKTHDKKELRSLDKSFLYYKDNKTGKEEVNLKNVISMFESSLTRSFGIKTNELTTDIFIVDVYYFDIAQDLILNGFMYNDKKYIYFSSSAGQIRTKKAVFVEENKFKLQQNKLTCGLTTDMINKKGGMNINKYLAYTSLCNSATELWEDIFEKEFDIDRSIVVDDFETLVTCKVDNIDYETYEITKDVTKDIPIPHTDGCGMILSSYCDKNFMVRLPFLKGLLGSFDYVKFIKTNQCSSKITDIWGQEYDIINDDIQIIFTKSQLKMYKFFDSWDEYKNNFKKYECEAGICSLEEDKISNAKINYQMLQSLYAMTDEEIKEICKYSKEKVKKITSSVENMMNIFGVYLDDENQDEKDYFQKALKLYPELLNDPSNKDNIRDLKDSLVKRYRSGKLDVLGKFTFVLPDLYAFCEWLFMNIKVPKGLLENGEVFCKLYKNSNKLDCLRSPSLYIEHAIRKNMCNKKYRNQKLSDWFQTNAIYTSTYDLITRILQLDVDGDKLLVLSQKKLIEIAERHMQGINPLYYEMKKANSKEINEQEKYNGLILAFTGGNIGGISNDITKIWNTKIIGEEELNAIKWLCMETNFTIDYAKTLFKPKRPEHVDTILKKYSNKKVPYFFYYAKDKKFEECEEINKSLMNKIVEEIEDTRLLFNSVKKLKKIDYKLFLKNQKDLYSNDKINTIYDNYNSQYGNNLKVDEDNRNKNNIPQITKKLKQLFYEVEPDDEKIINSLVKHLYSKPSNKKKKLLWFTYGGELYHNLESNINIDTSVCMKCGKRVYNNELVRSKCSECRKTEIKDLCGKKLIKCVDCNCEFEVDSKSNNRQRCDECKKKAKLDKYRKYNEKRKNTTSQIQTNS